MLNEKPPKITGTNFNTRKCVRFFPLSSLFTKREKNIKIVKVRTDWVTGILWLGYWKLLRVCVLSFFFTFLVRFPFLFPLNYFAAKKSLFVSFLHCSSQSLIYWLCHTNVQLSNTHTPKLCHTESLTHAWKLISKHSNHDNLLKIHNSTV